MRQKELVDLVKEEKTIGEELEGCGRTLENIGTLAIKIQAFTRAVKMQQDDSPEAQRLAKQAEAFNRTISKLSAQRSKLKSEENEELIRAKLGSRPKYMENTDTPVPETDEDFFSASTRRINAVLMNAMDAFEAVKRQNIYIDRTGERLRNGFSKVELIRSLIEKIDRRYVSDNVLFTLGIAFIVLVFILFRFFF
jgi:hypothetical protein